MGPACTRDQVSEGRTDSWGLGGERRCLETCEQPHIEIDKELSKNIDIDKKIFRNIDKDLA